MSMDLAQAFFEEAAELLSDFEASLLRLEESPNDPELLNRIFRCAHTLKGNSGMLGFGDIAQFTHALEDLLEKLRKDELAVTPVIVDTLLDSVDVVKGLLAEAKGEGPSDGNRREKALAAIRPLVSGAAPAGPRPRAKPATAAKPSSRQTLYEIHFAPPSDLFRRGLDPIQCLEALAQLGQVVQVSADTKAIPPLEEMDAEKCYLAWKVWLMSRAPHEEVEACFDFVAEPGAVSIDAQPMGEAGDQEEGGGETAPKARGPARSVAERGGSPAAAKADSSSIRVSTDKVDKLINLVGELVIVQSMINQVVGNFSPDKLGQLQEAVTDMERNTRELQERVMAVRMLPIGTIFGRFPRLVRDLATTFNKKVSLQLFGEETELDKGVIERIGDPLTHLIRNAVDHGIDTPEERLGAGKPEQGTIRLQAFHQGGNVIIEVADDGRGLNTEKIRQKAIDQGLIDAHDNLTEEQIHMLIFRAGFSTAATVSDVSGRGVGMDVVKKNVEALKGSVSIHSERGKGTRFRIRLPLTLAILDGLSLQVGERVYIVPLVSIVESIRPLPENLHTVLGRGEVVAVRGEFLPLLRLHRLFNIPAKSSDPSQGLVVIVENEGEQAALLVDELLGQQQVVIKSLESHFKQVEGIAGATILGDGRVALILDVPGLVALSRAWNPVRDLQADADPAGDRREWERPLGESERAV